MKYFKVIKIYFKKLKGKKLIKIKKQGFKYVQDSKKRLNIEEDIAGQVKRTLFL